GRGPGSAARYPLTAGAPPADAVRCLTRYPKAAKGFALAARYRRGLELSKANPSRDGDAKPEVSSRDSSAACSACPINEALLDRRTRMSKFKFRHAQLMLSIMSLVALVVASGASWKF